MIFFLILFAEASTEIPLTKDFHILMHHVCVSTEGKANCRYNVADIGGYFVQQYKLDGFCFLFYY